MPEWRLVFGYRHVTGLPRCPCADPGNYQAREFIAMVDAVIDDIERADV